MSKFALRLAEQGKSPAMNSVLSPVPGKMTYVKVAAGSAFFFHHVRNSRFEISCNFTHLTSTI